MKKVLLFLAFVPGCVPASEELPPAGAVGFSTEPSAAASGAPFMTDDGWTIRFDVLELQVQLHASPLSTRDSYQSSFDMYLWNARERIEMYAPGLSLGTWLLRPLLQPGYLGDMRRTTFGVPPENVARFDRPSDEGAGDYGYVRGPSVHVVVDAERAGRRVGFDLAIATEYDYDRSDQGPVLEVHEDALAATPLQVVPENLFRGAGAAGTSFQIYADADADGDGRLTVDELGAVSVDPTWVASKRSQMTNASLLDLLRTRFSKILVF